jgi:hypothetical protein
VLPVAGLAGLFHGGRGILLPCARWNCDQVGAPAIGGDRGNWTVRNLTYGVAGPARQIAVGEINSRGLLPFTGYGAFTAPASAAMSSSGVIPCSLRGAGEIHLGGK